MSNIPDDTRLVIISHNSVSVKYLVVVTVSWVLRVWVITWNRNCIHSATADTYQPVFTGSFWQIMDLFRSLDPPPCPFFLPHPTLLPVLHLPPFRKSVGCAHPVRVGETPQLKLNFIYFSSNIWRLVATILPTLVRNFIIHHHQAFSKIGLFGRAALWTRCRELIMHLQTQHVARFHE